MLLYDVNRLVLELDRYFIHYVLRTKFFNIICMNFGLHLTERWLEVNTHSAGPATNHLNTGVTGFLLSSSIR